MSEGALNGGHWQFACAGNRAVAAAIFMVSSLYGCATFPEVEATREKMKPESVSMAGARGPLSRQESAAVLRELKGRRGTPDILERHIALEEAVVGRPLVTGNRVRLLEDGPATYAAMTAAIRAARDHINLETYIFEDDEIGRKFADLLMEKQGDGVQVSIIYDSVGALRTPKEFFRRLSESGIQVLEYNPVNPLAAKRGWRINQRHHRKLLVVDGRIGFVGGINISDVYSSGSAAAHSRTPDGKSTNWRDTHISIEGPVVREFQSLFLEAWEKGRGPKLPARNYFPELKPVGQEVVRAVGSEADDPLSPIYATFVSAVESAEQHIHITVAYFVPDPRSLKALKEAAGRGVDVKIILPSHTDFWAVFHAGRSHYADLLQAGVKIYERQGALLHSKTVLVDGVWSSVGSTNWDARSFLHNNELNAVVLGRRFAQQMHAMFEKDLVNSDRIELEQWKRRPLLNRVKESFARIWEHWL
jgi:cardiolipin synthase A/B